MKTGSQSASRDPKAFQNGEYRQLNRPQSNEHHGREDTSYLERASWELNLWIPIYTSLYGPWKTTSVISLRLDLPPISYIRRVVLLDKLNRTLGHERATLSLSFVHTLAWGLSLTHHGLGPELPSRAMLLTHCMCP